MEKRMWNKEDLVIFFYDAKTEQLQVTKGECSYLKELLDNYKKEYGELSEECFIIGECDTIYEIGRENKHYIKNPIKLELDLDVDFDLNTLIKENLQLKYADPIVVHYFNLYKVLQTTLEFCLDDFCLDDTDIQYIGINEYVTQKYPELNSKDKSTIIQTMQDEIYRSILNKDIKETRKQYNALKKYEKYIGAKYKLTELETNQRKRCNLNDVLEIEFYDGTKILRTVEWIINHAKVINANIVLENYQVLFTGVSYHPEIWSYY